MYMVCVVEIFLIRFLKFIVDSNIQLHLSQSELFGVCTVVHTIKASNNNLILHRPIVVFSFE